ncbi:disks large-associated protein 1-like [Anoplophora glabripennis]|uniref:disks large-associated protein 1-like n=1 Tax=Anoplophora glabripennis TaxID=217634 RepID=UPI00087555F9|nr:disks large-associated protein 1-like [Anoplophora glabripennis]
MNRIEGIFDKWECYKSSNKLPKRANDMINVAIGWTRLLISNKFQQLRNLCVSYDDLHGIWDTIQVQVECLIKRFDGLNAMKANNWQEILPKDEAVLKRGRVRPKSKKVLARTVLENLTKAANDANKSRAEDEINLNVPQIDDNKASSGVA